MRYMPPMDRLSCLPDEVISHILSFLQTKYSAQTSLLSKRWKLLWAHVPLLDFEVNYSDFVNSITITKILLQCKHDIHTFRIHGRGDIDGSQEEFESLIVEITTRNVRKLVFEIFNVRKFPQCLFTCKTLVDLSLTFCKEFPTGGIYFPALKKINLFYVENLSHESLDCLLSGSPMLEELRIKGTVSGYCCLSSPMLTILVLKIYNYKTSDFGVKLDTPALRYLKLHCSMPDKFSVGTLDSLIEADIDLSWPPQQDRFIIYSRNLLALVGKLYNVKILTLSTHQDVVIHDDSFSASPIKFQNLTELRLGSNLGCITYFFENANNLQFIELNFRHEMVETDNIYCWMEPDRVPACLVSCLQIVVCYFGCSKQEFDIVKYILMNAKVLKRMEVRTQLHNDFKKKSEVHSKLALFERGSQECEIVFD